MLEDERLVDNGGDTVRFVETVLFGVLLYPAKLRVELALTRLLSDR